MQELESARPRLISGEILKETESIKFQNSVQNIRMPLQAYKPMRLMDGSRTLSELIFQVYREEKSLSFLQIYRLLTHLVEKKLLENWQDLLNLLEFSKSIQAETHESYTSRTTNPSARVEIDQSSAFIDSQVIDRIARTPLFRDISAQKIQKLTQKAKMRTFAKGLYLISSGSVTNKVFVLLSGKVGVLRGTDPSERQLLATLFPVSVFGEYAAFLGVKRTADVVALEDSTAMVIDVNHLREEKVVEISGLNADTPVYQELKRNVILSQTLSRSELFKNMPLELIQMIIGVSKTVTRSAGEVIIREGDIGKSFFILVDGGVAVIKQGIAINFQRPGDFFGEIALIKRVPRTATVKCKTNVILLQIDRDDFYQLLSENLMLAIFLEKEAELRMSPETRQGT